MINQLEQIKTDIFRRLGNDFEIQGLCGDLDEQVLKIIKCMFQEQTDS